MYIAYNYVFYIGTDKLVYVMYKQVYKVIYKVNVHRILIYSNLRINNLLINLMDHLSVL